MDTFYAVPNANKHTQAQLWEIFKHIIQSFSLFLFLGKKKRNSVKLIINTTEIEETEKVDLRGITIDNLLTFNEHIGNLYRTANYKLHALRRIRNIYP